MFSKPINTISFLFVLTCYNRMSPKKKSRIVYDLHHLPCSNLIDLRNILGTLLQLKMQWRKRIIRLLLGIFLIVNSLNVLMHSYSSKGKNKAKAKAEVWVDVSPTKRRGPSGKSSKPE